MRTDIKIGIVLSVFVVGVAAYYFSIPGEKDVVILGDDAPAEGAPAPDASSTVADADDTGSVSGDSASGKTSGSMASKQGDTVPAADVEPLVVSDSDVADVDRVAVLIDKMAETKETTDANRARSLEAVTTPTDRHAQRVPPPAPTSATNSTVTISLPAVKSPVADINSGPTGASPQAQPLPARKDHPAGETVDMKTVVVSTENRSATSGKPKKTAAPVKTHVVKEGESFASIARMHYGSEQYTRFLMRQNPQITDPHSIRIGQKLRIPELEVAQKSSKNPATVKQAGTGRYKVKKDDTFYAIASRTLGDGTRWPEIYELNRGLVGDSPTRLRAGQVLELPSQSGAGR